MSKYGQYCPVARSLELLGDRWTLLIVRDLLTGTRHFTELEQGLPGISRALLSSRLRQLQRAGIIEKRYNESSRNTTEYVLTESGLELNRVIGSLWQWGDRWAFGDPRPDELDPVLLMSWMRRRAAAAQRPQARIVLQFDFRHLARAVSFWLVMKADDVTLCLTDPGYEIDLLVSSELLTFFRLYGGRISYRDALDLYGVTVEGSPDLMRAFPHWFGWSTGLEPQPVTQIAV